MEIGMKSFKEAAKTGYLEGKKRTEESILKKIKPINERHKPGRVLMFFIFVFCFFGIYASKLEISSDSESMLSIFFSAIAIIGTWTSIFIYILTVPARLGLRLGKISWAFALFFGLALLIDFAVIGKILGTAPAGTIPVTILIVHIKAVLYSRNNVTEIV